LLISAVRSLLRRAGGGARDALISRALIP